MRNETPAPAAQPSASIGLKPSDVQALLAEPVPQRRSEVAAKVAAEIDAGRLNDAERPVPQRDGRRSR